jgi:hypothetical protein
MEFYSRITVLHKSDKHVLHTYKSGFYEYSPEAFSEKYPVESEKKPGIKKNTPVYFSKDKFII